MAVSAGPVQWQMDIAGLTGLFINAGAHGLKQIALAGVDPHTIGCLLMLGELSPICLEFRKRLNACRNEQKKSRKFIYKVIEIGTATNFLADELLKRRPGENVLALLTATVSVLSENCYTDALVTMYSTSNVDVDSTPGIGQLQRLRAALLPFINAMDIKNKILQYHVHFCQYASQSHEPHHGIPDARTMSSLIHTFHKIVTSSDDYRLVYRGIIGAGWAAAYAWDILGLGACIMLDRPEGQTCIPMSSGYEDARIVFCPDLDTGEPELRKAGRMEELIKRSSIANTDIEWTIDCDAVSYFATHHPRLNSSPLHTKISEFVAAKTMDCVAQLSHDLSYSVNLSQPQFALPPDLLSYQRFILPSVQKRALLILQILGFSPPAWDTFELDGLGYTKGLKARKGSESDEDLAKPPKSANKSKDSKSFWSIQRDSSEDAWWPIELEQGFERFLDYWNLAASSSDSLKFAAPEVSIQWLDTAAILRTVKNAVLFASYMAFTDWHLSLRRMSVEFFSFAVLLQGGSRGNINEGNGMRKIQRFCSAHPSPEPLFWALGQELNGIVLLRQVPLSQTIHELDGILICFQPGQIIFEGERCMEIHVTDVKNASQSYGFYPPKPNFRPYAIETSIETTSSFRLAGGRVFMSMEIQRQGSLVTSTPADRTVQQIISIHPELIAEGLTRLLVTAACCHDYYDQLPNRFIEQCTWKEGLTVGFSFVDSQRKLSIDKNSGRPKLKQGEPPNPPHLVYYQAVDGHGLGQWLACHLPLSSRSIIVLQRGACLACTLSRAFELKSMHSELQDEDICIIAGRDPKAAPSQAPDDVTLVDSG